MILRRTLAWWLAVTGAALLPLFIPNGVMHIYLGKLIYARDLAVFLHLAITLYCLHRTGHLTSLYGKVLPLAIFAAFFLPLLSASSTLKDALIIFKWVALWSDALLTGYLIYLHRSFLKTVAAIGVFSFSLVTLDGLIGLYEVRTNSFFFAVEDDQETDVGVKLTRSAQLGFVVRAQGLQRDVFSFANFMGVGVATCLAVFAGQRRRWLRMIAALGVVGFTYVASSSGGRSVLFGIALAVLFFALAMLSPPNFFRHSRKILTAVFFVECVFCLTGLNKILKHTFELVASNSRVFDRASTGERDVNWWDRLNAMWDSPVSFFAGMPTADWVDGTHAGLLFADHLFLWLLYHAGIGGLIMMFVYFYRMARPATAAQHPQAYIALVLFMALVFGEGLARDTLFMFSAVPMFLLGGYFAGSDAFEKAAARSRLTPSAETTDLPEELEPSVASRA